MQFFALISLANQPKQPVVNTSKNKLDSHDAETWIGKMSAKLKERLPNQNTRLELLRIAYEEAKRAGLEPGLVLAIADSVSNLHKEKVSGNGAIGYMQIMPAWLKLMENPNQNLRQTRINFRYGCSIMRMYLDTEEGDLFLALNRYEQATLHGPGSDIDKVLPQFPRQVLKAWNKYRT